MHIYTYEHVCTHTHLHIYTHTHTNCTYERMQARLERRRGSERARSCCRERKLCTSLLFDAIKPHFAPPMQGLFWTHFLKHQYPSTPHPLFPTFPRTVRGPRASAVVLFYTAQMNRVHSSESAPRSFTMAPCVVAERLEGKQRCSRAAVSEHAGIQAREWSRWVFTKKRKVNEKTTNPCNRPKKNHDSAAPRQHPAHLHWCGSTQFLANPCRWPQRRSPETRLHFYHFRRSTVVSPSPFCTSTTCRTHVSPFAQSWVHRVQHHRVDIRVFFFIERHNSIDWKTNGEINYDLLRSNFIGTSVRELRGSLSMLRVLVKSLHASVNLDMITVSGSTRLQIFVPVMTWNLLR